MGTQIVIHVPFVPPTGPCVGGGGAIGRGERGCRLTPQQHFPRAEDHHGRSIAVLAS